MSYNRRKSYTGLNRRDAIRLGAAAAALPLLGDVAALCQLPAAVSTPVEWRHYAGDNASTKYSTLDQITAEKFSSLKVAWTWRSVEEELAKAHNLKTWAWEATPLMIDGVLYLTTSLSRGILRIAGKIPISVISRMPAKHPVMTKRSARRRRLARLMTRSMPAFDDDCHKCIDFRFANHPEICRQTGLSLREKRRPCRS